MAHAGGRPTKLTKALIAEGWQYLEDTGTMLPNALLPTVEGLALRLGVSRDTIYEWEANGGNQEFSDIVAKLRALQGEKLIQKSLSGQYNSTIAKLILSGKHGYVEKKETDITTAGKELPQPILALPKDVLPDNGDKQAS